MTVQFTPIAKQRSYLRMFLVGPSGSGKTHTAAGIAQAFGRVAVLDTERGSFGKCELSRDFDYAGIQLTDSYHPNRYIEIIQAAAASGFDCLIIDSLSHAWEAEGGILDVVDAASARAKGNTFAGWKEGTPAYRGLIDAILQAPIHVIATMRSKTEWVLEQGANGKTVPRRIGTQPVMRQNVEYEADIVGDLDYEHNLTFSKSRFAEIADLVVRKPGRELGERILGWLNDGGEPVEPVWRSRWDEAVAAVGEARAGELVKGADPSVLASDAAWHRLQQLVKDAQLEATLDEGGAS